MPSAEDTGFFDISEQEMAQIDMDNRSIKRKHGHSGLRRFLIFLLFVLLIGGAAAYAYYNGYGWPLQESVVEDLFTTNASGGDISKLLAESVDDDSRAEIEAVLPDGASGVTVEGVDRSMNESSALVTVTLSAGGEQSYRSHLVRDGLGWKVDGVTVEYPALDGGEPAIDTGEPGEAEATDAGEADAEETEAARPAEGDSSRGATEGEDGRHNHPI